MRWVGGRICAAHRSQTAREHEPSSSRLINTMFLMPRDDLQQLSQHIDHDVPQPAHTSQLAARSVERAMRASHGAARWACKVSGHGADLVRLPGARRAVHRDLVGAVQDKFFNLCLKGLRGRVSTNMAHTELLWVSFFYTKVKTTKKQFYGSQTCIRSVVAPSHT